MAKFKDGSGKRVKRMSITVSEEIYNGVRALSALSGKTINDYVFGLLADEVNKNVPAIQQIFEAQKKYQQAVLQAAIENQQSLFQKSDETEKAAE